MPIRTLIMGAAGRDFHNFNVFFRKNPDYKVVAFTATQIPNIEGRKYPSQLSGENYPEGIPIHPEEELTSLIDEMNIHQVIFAYSDVSHEYVMHKASEVLAAGADFRLMGLDSTQIKSEKPVVSVCAVRTGSGKSQTTRRVAQILKRWDIKWRSSVIRCLTAIWSNRRCKDLANCLIWINTSAPLKNGKNMSLISSMMSLFFPALITKLSSGRQRKKQISSSGMGEQRFTFLRSRFSNCGR